MINNISIVITYILLLMGALNCKRDFSTLTYSKTDDNTIILFDDINQIQISDDPVNLIEAYADSQYLFLTVEYTGGCKDHEFVLFGWSGFHRNTFPTVGEIFLSHDSKGDRCEALIRKNLQFLLTSLGNRALNLDYKGDTLILHLFLPGSTVHHEPAIKYIFTEPCGCSFPEEPE